MPNDTLVETSLKNLVRHFARSFAHELIEVLKEKGVLEPLLENMQRHGGLKGPHSFSNTPRLIPVNKWNDYHDSPSKGGLRRLIFFANSNGFDKCIRRIGRSVLIHEVEFFKWVEEQNR